MWNPDFGWGFGHGLAAIFANIVMAFAWILCLSVTIAVLFLLVRFLLVATRAAQFYVAHHEPQRPAAPVKPAASATPPTPAASAASTAVAKPATASTAVAKPATASTAAPKKPAAMPPTKPGSRPNTPPAS